MKNFYDGEYDIWLDSLLIIMVCLAVVMILQGCSIRVCECHSDTDRSKTLEENASDFALKFTP